MTTKSEITRRDTKKNINCRYFGDILHVYIILEEMLMLWLKTTYRSFNHSPFSLTKYNRHGFQGEIHRQEPPFSFQQQQQWQRTPFPRRSEEALGPIRRRDPRSRQEKPRLARYLRYSRGGGACLRHRRPPVPRR